MAAYFLFIFLLPGRINFKSRVSASGPASTQLRQVLHSSETTVLTLSTFMYEGQAFAHNPQSIQLTGFRLILLGLRNETIPSRAPYGQRNLHQKFLINIERTKRTAIMISAVCDISAKK